MSIDFPFDITNLFEVVSPLRHNKKTVSLHIVLIKQIETFQRKFLTPRAMVRYNAARSKASIGSACISSIENPGQQPTAAKDASSLVKPSDYIFQTQNQTLIS